MHFIHNHKLDAHNGGALVIVPINTTWLRFVELGDSLPVCLVNQDSHFLEIDTAYRSKTIEGRAIGGLIYPRSTFAEYNNYMYLSHLSTIPTSNYYSQITTLTKKN